MIDTIHNEDCLLGMQRIPDHSVDMILCDLPYGKLECSWDSVIPFEPLWVQYKRVLKENGTIALTALQPFTSRLVLANEEMFKYALVWKKSRMGFFPHARFRPLGEHEDILVFSRAGLASNARMKPTYHPQGIQAIRKRKKGKAACAMRPDRKRGPDFVQETTNYPRSILNFASESKPIHPTQKPVALFEYLIRTYSNPGEVVLDNAIGSGTTAIAAINTGRHYIGFEKDPKCFEVAQKRISSHRAQLKLLDQTA